MKTIYKLTDIFTGSIYIGATSNLRRRVNEHRKHRDGVCLKYGMGEFKVEVIETVGSKQDGNSAEAKWCKYYAELGSTVLGQKFGQEFSCELTEKFSKLKTEEFYSGKSRARVLGMNDGRKTKVIDQFGSVYESLSDCARKIKSHPTSVLNVINGKAKHTKGFILKRFI